MSIRLSHLLRAWRAAGDDTAWVLGTVYETEGSAYRRAGAMMLFDGAGRQLGLLSGGCLEADIQIHAKKAMQTGRAATIRYDGRDEDDLSFHLGIGCGGVVQILLQPVTPGLGRVLTAVSESLDERGSGVLSLRLPSDAGAIEARYRPTDPDTFAPDDPEARLVREDGIEWLAVPILPDPHLLVVGGGADARPLVRMARELGWRVSLADPRPANARREHFPQADDILRDLGDALTDHARRGTAEAAVVMTHNLRLDAQALRSLQGLPLKYLALLGPRHRCVRVLEEAGLTERDFPVPVAGPAGLDIGADLPESIALAILAECHAALKDRPGGRLIRT